MILSPVISKMGLALEDYHVEGDELLHLLDEVEDIEFGELFFKGAYISRKRKHLHRNDMSSRDSNE